MLPSKFEYRLDLRHHVTPHLMKNEPIHRWFIFPHSYSPQLLDEVVKHYPLNNDAILLDPFAGAGTTILWAKQNGYSATGTDLSPLSVFVSQAKLEFYNAKELTDTLLDFKDIKFETVNIDILPERIRKAFSPNEIAYIYALKQLIHKLPTHTKNFFLLGLLNVQKNLSRAVRDGGWFRWVDKPDQFSQIPDLFEQQITQQISDIHGNSIEQSKSHKIHLLDARLVDTLPGIFDGIITSPPYPNRHDYSRIFHMELLSLGASEEDIFQFRRSSIRSHVEARKPEITANGYKIPAILNTTLSAIPVNADSRIIPMLTGYFEDMYICLKSAYKRLNHNAVCAFVVGNVRHAGVMVYVDEILAEIGEQVGLRLDKAWVARLRGNSAQQMAVYGREPARETIVIFRKV